MIKIVLVDVNEEGKDQITNRISSHKDLMIQGTGKDNYDAIMLVSKFHPDIVMLNATLGIYDGVEITCILKRCSPSTEIVIFSSRIEDRLIREVVKGKITGCLLMSTDMDRLAVILRGIYHGEYYVNSRIAARAFQILGEYYKGKVPEKEQSREKSISFILNLSRMELRILRLVADGCTSKEMAQTLSLKEGTIRNYISQVMHKTGLKTRTQVVLYALHNGLGRKDYGLRIRTEKNLQA